MSAAELLSWSLADLAARIRGGDVSSREATDRGAGRRSTDPAGALNAVARLEPEAALAAADRADAVRANGGIVGSAARRADGAQGHVLPCGLGGGMRLGLVGGAPADGHGLGDRAAGRRRCGRCRAAQHGRVRVGHHRPQPAHRPSPKPLGPCADHRRLDQRRRCRRRGPADPGDAGLRHRRLDPRAGSHLRRVRAEADLWPGQPRRLHAAVVLARPCRPAGALARGSGADAGGDRRA